MSHELADKRRIIQHAVAAFAAHCYRIPSEAALDLAQTSFEDLLRSIEQADVVADLLCHFHLVCREDDGLARAFEIEDDLFQQFDVDRIESRERLVENQEIRIVNDGSDELNLLLHSFRQLHRTFVFPLGEFYTCEPLVDPRFDYLAA